MLMDYLNELKILLKIGSLIVLVCFFGKAYKFINPASIVLNVLVYLSACAKPV